MEVKPGYKQTEVGVIPEEWGVSSLEDCCKKITDGTHDTPRPVKTGVPFLTAIHVKDNRIAYDECLFVSKVDHEIIFKRCNPENGDVLMVNIGAGVATTALVEVDYEFSLKNVALLKPDSECLSGAYLNYCLAKKKDGTTQALLSGGAQPFLSLTQIGQIRISTPPLREQRAIAGALSDVDALIGALGQLIAKKRDLKQAAMQQLLTGQKRLPGFHGEWEVKTLGEVASVSKGTQLHSSEANLSAKFAHLNGGITPSGYTHKSNTPANTIAISEGGNSCGYVQFLPEPYWCGGHCYSVIPNGIDNRFLYHALKGQQSAIMGLRVGSGLPNVQKTALRAFKLRYPATEAEQSAIAEVLSDMDAELAALEQRRDKTHALKQGMMQGLLTGRIRLI
jgi:type I restriction enzyme, S subunit